MKKLAIGLLVFAAMFSSVGAGVATAKTVRIPTGAADWATFTPAERQAAYDWELQQVKASNKAPVTVSMARAVIQTGGISPLSLSASGYCAFSYIQNGSGTLTWSWADLTTSQVVYRLDTGITQETVYYDRFFRNNSQIDGGYGSSAGSSTHVYSESATNWKWWWEGATYTTQDWYTVQTGPYTYYWYLAYCHTSWVA